MNSDIFLILFIIVLAMITVFPLALRRLYIPGVIALLIAGMALGENQLNLFHHLSGYLTSHLGGDAVQVEAHFHTFVNSLGNLGLVFLMALAGMEADFKLLKSVRKPVAALSLLTFGVPAIAGYFVYAFFRTDDLPGKLLYASLFASHSVGIVFPVMRELKLSKTRFGAAVLISTVITDIASIILLAVCVQMKRMQIGGMNAGEAAQTASLSLLDRLNPAVFGHWFLPLFVMVVLGFILLASLCVWYFGGKTVRYIQSNEDILITFLLLVILLTVLVGEFIGINLIVSAFIAGLALSPLLKQKGISAAVFTKFEGIGYSFLIPFLFISIGMQTDLSVMAMPGNIKVVLLTILGLVVSKVFSGWLALRITGFDNAHGLCAGLMTVPQLSATLAAAAVGRSLQMLDDNFFNAIVVLSIATTIPIPSLVRGIISHTKMRFSATEVEAYAVPAEDANEDDVI